MTPETIKQRRAKPKVPPLEPEDRAWLRGLACIYARPLPAFANIPALVAYARKLAARIERADLGDSASTLRRRHGDELDRGADVLEQLDALRQQLLDERRTTLEVLPFERRADIVRHAPAVLAIVNEPAKAAEHEEASAWLLTLTVDVVRVLALVVRLESTLSEVEDLRRRAFHSLYALVQRSHGR